MRNLSIAVAVVLAAGSVPDTAVLPIALAYVIQPPLGAVYMNYRRDIVGEGLSLRAERPGVRQQSVQSVTISCTPVSSRYEPVALCAPPLADRE